MCLPLPPSLRDAGLPEPPDDARRHSAWLCETIRRDIDLRGGWIGFDRFMQLALYEPGQGYYVAGATKLGGDGDFVTAPSRP